VKTGFNQRRKTLRNALKQIMNEVTDAPFMDKRAEELHWTDFVTLTNHLKSK
jgi:16S rRNA (adenine1518-N6/adenine1519-N6)-dimethyltransferase